MRKLELCDLKKLLSVLPFTLLFKVTRSLSRRNETDIFPDTCKRIPQDYAETTAEKFRSCLHTRKCTDKYLVGNMQLRNNFPLKYNDTESVIVICEFFDSEFTFGASYHITEEEAKEEADLHENAEFFPHVYIFVLTIPFSKINSYWHRPTFNRNDFCSRVTPCCCS